MSAGIAASITARVVTLMPPPVLPGAAPMNIHIIIIITVAGSRREKSTELKPPERSEMLWNSAWSHFQPGARPCSDAFHSSSA